MGMSLLLTVVKGLTPSQLYFFFVSDHPPKETKVGKGPAFFQPMASAHRFTLRHEINLILR